MIRKTVAVFLAAYACAGLSASAAAQDAYPSKSITVISPHQAGGATELLMRLLSEDMTASMGQSLVIVAHPGAAGTIGAKMVSDSKPDGYTLLANPSMHVMYPGMFKKLAFDPMKDFVPVGVLGTTPIVVVVSANSPYKTFEELMAAAKKGTVSFASGGLGSLPHLTGEMVANRAGVTMTHVAYNGNAQALVDVAGGHVDSLYSAVSSAESLIKGGKLRALAVSSKERMAALPDVPTIAESGMPGFDVTNWYAVWAPKNTDPKIVAKLNSAMRQAASLPKIKERMQALSVTPSTMTAEQFSAFCESENKTWLDVMKKANLQPN